MSLQINNQDFDPWKKIEINNSMSLDELLDFFKKTYNITLLNIFIENIKVFDKSGEVPKFMAQNSL